MKATIAGTATIAYARFWAKPKGFIRCNDRRTMTFEGYRHSRVWSDAKVFICAESLSRAWWKRLLASDVAFRDAAGNLIARYNNGQYSFTTRGVEMDFAEDSSRAELSAPGVVVRCRDSQCDFKCTEDALPVAVAVTVHRLYAERLRYG